MGGDTGWAPLAASSESSPLTASGDIDGGSCSTIVAPPGSAAQMGGMPSRSSTMMASDRASIGGNLAEISS